MGWRGVTVMDQRIRFLSDYLEGFYSFSELCQHFGVSRKTGYKWVGRYRDYGVEGLEERSRRPLACPHQTDDAIIQAIVRERRKHRTWGPKKLLHVIGKRHPEWTLPAISTAADILKRKGLIEPKRRRLRRQHPGCPKTTCNAPNEIWTADYKGHFKMLNGQYCYPLTVCDMHSRYLLGCSAHSAISLVASQVTFTRLFKTYGLPERIRTDNGVPFASSAIARLSALSVWWIKLGVYPEQIEPGKPQQNGKHERMHRTLKKEATIPPGRHLTAQQQQLNAFREEYNKIRPHESLDMKTPAEVYTASNRKMPENILPYEYPQHFEVRRVSRNGGIRWHHHRVPVSQTLIEDRIGFEEIDDGVYNVYFRELLIGRFYEEMGIIKDVIKRVPMRHQNPRPV